MDLLVIGGAPGARKLEQVLQRSHPDGPGPFEERMKNVGRRLSIGQRAVIRGDGRSEVSGKAGQAEVADLLPDQTPGESGRVDRSIGQPAVAETFGGSVQEREVEPHVVADDHGVTAELEKRRQGLVDRWSVDDHRLGDSGEDHDRRWDLHAGIDQCLERAEQVSAAHLDRADLGDLTRRRRSPRCLQVHDAESDIVEGGAEVVE